MMTHKALVRKMLKQPAVKAEYDAQAEEFALLDELLKARRQAGLTQAEVAARMGTKTPAVARLEAGGQKSRYSQPGPRCRLSERHETGRNSIPTGSTR